jgi:hypothetical protein
MVCLILCYVAVGNHKNGWYDCYRHLPTPTPPPQDYFCVLYVCHCIYVCSAFTSEDQPRVKGPRTRRQGKEQGDRGSGECRTLRSVPEEGEPGGGGGVGGGVRVLRGREPRSTSSGSKNGQQQTQQFPTSRGLVSRPVRFA